jgi:hypothetical protein
LPDLQYECGGSGDRYKGYNPPAGCNSILELRCVRWRGLKLDLSYPFVKAVLRILDSGSGAFLTPGSGMGKSQMKDQGSRMNTPDLIFENLVPVSVFWVKYGSILFL